MQKSKKKSFFLRMIFSSLLRRRSRMLIALLAIAIGAAILSGLVTIYYDVPRQMGAQFRNYGANMIFTPASDERLTPEEIEEGVAIIDDLELVGYTPYRYETVRIHSTPVMAAGIDFESAQKTSPYWSVDGDYPSEAHQLMVGASVASTYGLDVGDVIEVTFTPESEVTSETEGESEDSEDEDLVLDNYIDFTVVSILNTGGSEEDYLYMSLEDLEELTGTSTKIDVTEVSISTSSEKLNSYLDEINESTDNISAKLVKRVTASETTVLGKLQALILLVTVIVLAMTMITVATTMTAVVTERRKEIGLKKALGAHNDEIRKEFLYEQLFLGAFGGLIGGILGFIFAQFISVNVFASSIAFRPLLLPITIAISILVTALSCLLPIRSATDIEPALVLKGE